MGVESKFLVDDPVEFFTKQWNALKDVPLEYPNNQCLNCAYLGLCLRQKRFVEDKLVNIEEQPVHG